MILNHNASLTFLSYFFFPLHTAYISRLLEHCTEMDSQPVRPSAASPKSTGAADLARGSELSQRFWQQWGSPTVPGLCAYCTALSDEGPAGGKSCQHLPFPSWSSRRCSPHYTVSPRVRLQQKMGQPPCGHDPEPQVTASPRRRRMAAGPQG